MFFPDGPKWKIASKVTHAALRTDAAKQYAATQELYLRQLLISLLDRPQDYYDEIRMYALYLIHFSIAMTLYTQGDEPHHGCYHVRDVTRGDGQGGRSPLSQMSRTDGVCQVRQRLRGGVSAQYRCDATRPVSGRSDSCLWVLAYADERALIVLPVKHIPSWIPGSPQGYGQPLEKRLRAVFEEPFDYVQSKMVGFLSHFEGVR
jgi:hypothetical protein